MKRFDVRETARDEEVEALEHAKAIPSEAKIVRVTDGTLNRESGSLISDLAPVWT